MKKQLSDESATLLCAEQLAKAVSEPLIIYLNGPLGAGKTCFARGFLQGLGFSGPVTSPTYTLVEEYTLAAHSVCHFDLYRLENPNELEAIGARDYFNKSMTCLIEWPEKGKNHLPQSDICVYIEQSGTGRDIEILAISDIGSRVLEVLEEK